MDPCFHKTLQMQTRFVRISICTTLESKQKLTATKQIPNQEKYHFTLVENSMAFSLPCATPPSTPLLSSVTALQMVTHTPVWDCRSRFCREQSKILSELCMLWVLSERPANVTDGLCFSFKLTQAKYGRHSKTVSVTEEEL